MFVVYHISNLVKYRGTEACDRRHKRQTDNLRTKYDLYFFFNGQIITIYRSKYRVMMDRQMRGEAPTCN